MIRKSAEAGRLALCRLANRDVDAAHHQLALVLSQIFVNCIFQLDREDLLEHSLRRAVARGGEVDRPGHRLSCRPRDR